MTIEKSFFTLALSSDKMKAVLILKYNESFYSNTVEFIYKQILSFLNENGILFGIQKNKIMQMISNVQISKKDSDAFTCAVGQPVIHSKPYQYKFSIEMQKDNLQKWLSSGSSYTIVKSLQPVKAKDVILDILPGERGIAGTNVLGETIQPNMYPVIKVEAGLNVKDFNHQHYTALVDGIVQIERNFISVLPFEEMRILSEISADKMQAFVSAIATEQKRLVPSEKSVLKSLSRNKIKAGINKTRITEFIESIKNNSYHGEKVLIAEGQVPYDGTSAKFLFHFKINPEEMDFPLDAVQWDETHSDLFHRDQLVAEKIIPVDEQDGFTVLGEILKAKKKKDWKLNIEQNLIIKDDIEKKKRLYYATVGGHVQLKGKTLFLLPYEDASFNLKIQEDFSKALIDLYPSKGGGKQLNYDSILSELQLENIVFGVKKDILKKAIEDVNAHEKSIKNLLIAEADPEENGKNGFLNLFFKTTADLIDNDDIQIDFKQREAIPFIEKTKLMARIVPATTGKAGKNIKGEEIPPKNGVDIVLKLGENVEQKGNEIFAKISGWPIYRNNMINVLPYYETEGDVNYSTGNIIFHGTVMVKGDIQTGFKVDATNGDVIVAGNCNQGILKASGNIIVKGGVIKSVVTSRNNFIAKFVEYSRVNSQGNIEILSSSLNNILMAKKSIFVNKGKGVILGGKSFAQATIQCLVAGNDAQVETYLFTGEDFFSKQKIRKLKKHIQTVLEEKNNLELFVQENGIDEQMQKKISLLSHQLNRLNLFEQALSDKIQTIHLKQESYIYVKSNIFLGTIISLKESNIKIKSDIKNMLFQFDFSKEKIEMHQSPKTFPKISV